MLRHPLRSHIPQRIRDCIRDCIRPPHWPLGRAQDRALLLVLAAWLGLGLRAPAQTPSAAVIPAAEVSHVQDETGTLAFYADLSACDEATLTLSVSGYNFGTSVAFPETIQIHKGHPVPLALAFPEDPAQPWHANLHFDFKLGTQLLGTPARYVYALPYAPTQHFKVMQGFFGTFSHQKGTADEYGVDFEMPTGTSVLAARPGRVTAVREDSSEGGPDKSFQDKANFILVAHTDGTYAAYYHLKQHGSAVYVGDVVKAGQRLGDSGATGLATAPHLHFAVYYNVDGRERKSLPVLFRTAQGEEVTPKEGQSY